MTTLSSLLKAGFLCKNSSAFVHTILKRTQYYSSEIKTESPYKKPEAKRVGYNSKIYDGGYLPRPDSHADIPLNGMQRYNPAKRDQWTEEKAVFGQNDNIGSLTSIHPLPYVDILSDSKVRPVDLVNGPSFIRGFKGNEFQRLLRRMKFEGSSAKLTDAKLTSSQECSEDEIEVYSSVVSSVTFLHSLGKKLKAMQPTRYHNMQKQLKYLYKQLNVYRSHAPFWGGRNRAQHSRIERIRDW